MLHQFGGMLRTTCRQSDVIGRLGGEEFAVLRAGDLVRGRGSTSRRASSRRAARSSSMAPQATCDAHAASASPKCTRTMSGWTAC